MFQPNDGNLQLASSFRIVFERFAQTYHATGVLDGLWSQRLRSECQLMWEWSGIFADCAYWNQCIAWHPVPFSCSSLKYPNHVKSCHVANRWLHCKEGAALAVLPGEGSIWDVCAVQACRCGFTWYSSDKHPKTPVGKSDAWLEEMFGNMCRAGATLLAFIGLKKSQNICNLQIQN